MIINKISKCGTLESNDIYIVLSPSDNGIEIEVESSVEKQFGKEIKKTIEKKLNELGIKSVKINAKDNGALDFTIRARIEVAVARGCKK
ncbi:MAG: citrate lyase acyl carrier protein [Fusobacteriaceae bacterium]